VLLLVVAVNAITYDEERGVEYGYPKAAQNEVMSQVFPSLTKTGFKKMETPKDLQRMLEEFLFECCPDPSDKACGTIETEGNVISLYEDKENDGSRSRVCFVTREMSERIGNVYLPIFQEWYEGEDKLEISSIYGIRSYHAKASLKMHVDRPKTHIISAILNVAQDVDSDWPLVIKDFENRLHNVTMSPGETVLYESMTLCHGRPHVLEGRYYSNIFIHSAPKNWISETSELFELALWEQAMWKQRHRGELFIANTMDRMSKNGTQIMVTFQNLYPNIAVEIVWHSPRGMEDKTIRLLEPQRMTEIATSEGHRFSIRLAGRSNTVLRTVVVSKLDIALRAFVASERRVTSFVSYRVEPGVKYVKCFSSASFSLSLSLSKIHRSIHTHTHTHSALTRYDPNANVKIPFELTNNLDEIITLWIVVENVPIKIATIRSHETMSFEGHDNYHYVTTLFKFYTIDGDLNVPIDIIDELTLDLTSFVLTGSTKWVIGP